MLYRLWYAITKGVAKMWKDINYHFSSIYETYCRTAALIAARHQYSFHLNFKENIIL